MSSTRKTPLRLVLGASVIALFAACGPTSGGPSGTLLSDEQPEVEETSSLALKIEDVAEKYQIPSDVLKSIAYNLTSFEPAVGDVEFDGQPAAYGVFALSGEELDRAAELIGQSVEDILGDESLEMEAMAALLSEYAYEEGLTDERRFDPQEWAPAIGRYGKLDPEMAEGFKRDVLNTVREGLAVPMLDGSTLVIRKWNIAGMEEPLEVAESGAGLGAAGVIWRPSPNYNSRPSSRVYMVVIHSCEGGYAGCTSWLRNRAASASAHYTVKEDGREVSQLVDENRRAWHVAANYRSRLNGGRLTGLEGRSTNDFSIGIEHGGFARQSRWPQAQIDRSVRLVRDITARHNIPRDRYHIVAHGRLQPETRTDPGPNWPWTSYIQAIAGGGSNPPPPAPGPAPAPTGGSIIVDNTTSGRFRASSNWATSSWAAGKIGANYRYRGAAERSDPADYKIAVPRSGRYEVFARVPGNGYNTNQPFVIHHAGGRSVVHRNISSQGGRWVSLGTYSFAAKDDWIVQVSCWTNGRGWIIGDAIRLDPR